MSCHMRTIKDYLIENLIRKRYSQLNLLKNKIFKVSRLAIQNCYSI